MNLSIVQKAYLLRKVSAREQHLNEMQEIIDKGRQEKRSLTADENSKLDNLENQIRNLDAELDKHGLTQEELETQLTEHRKKQAAAENKEQQQEKKVETRSILPHEVRSYKKGERMSSGSNNITMGDIIVAHTTGRFRTPEIRELLTTNSGGVTISEEVYAGFLDLLRSQSFLGEFTTYKMDSKTLTIPRVTGDVQPNFKLEADEIPLSNPVFTGATLSSKYLYCLTEISLELLESSAIDIGAAVNSIMSKSMMSSIQRFALTGAAPNGYSGILNDADINRIDGAVSYATIGAGIQAVQSVNGAANDLVINPIDWMGLQLLVDTGNQFITPPKFLEDMNIVITNSIDVGQALVGNLSTVGMGVNSAGGLQLDVNAAPGFTRGVVHVRARFSGDIVLTDPKQLSLISAAV